MSVSKKKVHSVNCGNRLQSASFPDARHPVRYEDYATSEETNSIVIGIIVYKEEV